MSLYVYYEGALTSTQTKNVFSNMGGFGYSGWVANDASTSATTLGVAVSYDFGTSFGSTIIVKNSEVIPIDGQITQVQVVCGTNANYRLYVSGNKVGVQ